MVDVFLCCAGGVLQEAFTAVTIHLSSEIVKSAVKIEAVLLKCDQVFVR